MLASDRASDGMSRATGGQGGLIELRAARAELRGARKQLRTVHRALTVAPDRLQEELGAFGAALGATAAAAVRSETVALRTELAGEVARREALERDLGRGEKALLVQRARTAALEEQLVAAAAALAQHGAAMDEAARERAGLEARLRAAEQQLAEGIEGKGGSMVGGAASSAQELQLAARTAALEATVAALVAEQAEARVNGPCTCVRNSAEDGEGTVGGAAAEAELAGTAERKARDAAAASRQEQLEQGVAALLAELRGESAFLRGRMAALEQRAARGRTRATE